MQFKRILVVLTVTKMLDHNTHMDTFLEEILGKCLFLFARYLMWVRIARTYESKNIRKKD